MLVSFLYNMWTIHCKRVKVLYNGNMGKSYELKEYEGHNEKHQGKMVRLYEDGSLRDERGYFIEQHKDGTPITAENSRALARTRWEKFREAAADHVAAEMGSIVPGIKTPESAWGVLNARTAMAIMDSDKPRGRDLQALGRNMGAIPGPNDVDQGENGSPEARFLRDLADVARAFLDDGDNG